MIRFTATQSMSCDKFLSEIEERCKAATAGPWERRDGDTWWDIRNETNEPIVSCGMEGEVTVGYEDAEFIAHSRTDIETLVKMVRCAKEVILLAANPRGINNWPQQTFNYCPRLEAKAALAELGRLAEEGK